MPMKAAAILFILLAGCSATAFDFTPEGPANAVHVTDDQDVVVALEPLQYRMRSDEGHLVLWIENPTDQAIEMIGDKSVIVDPAGVNHPLHNAVIDAHSSIKEVLPPLADEDQSPDQNAVQPINPYDRPGFIAVPDTAPPGDDQNSPWQWDDETEIHVNLLFQQGERQFEQHFSVRRVRK